MALSSW